MGLGKKESTFGNDTSQAFTYDHQNKYLMNFQYSWSSLEYSNTTKIILIIRHEIYNLTIRRYTINRQFYVLKFTWQDKRFII